MNKYQILVIGILFCSTLFGQSEAVEFSFDGCTYESSGAPFPGLTPNGDISCSCGVSEDAIVLDQPNEFVAFSELTQGLLSDDYTIDFYFKNSNTICQNCIILGLKNDCVGLDSFFVLRYTSFTNELTFEIGSDVNNFFSVKTELNSDICWHRFTLVKFGLVYTIYVDNVEVGRFLSKETIVFSQLGRLSISDSPCIGTNLT